MLDIFKAALMVNCFPLLGNYFAWSFFLCPLPLHAHTHTHTHTQTHTQTHTHIKFPPVPPDPAYVCVLFCLCLKWPCLRVLGLFMPCGPVMRCPPPPPPQPITAISARSAPLYCTVLCVLYALERVQRRSLTYIKPSIHCSEEQGHDTAPLQVNIQAKKKHKKIWKQNQHLHFCKIVDLFSPHWSSLSCLFFYGLFLW